MFKKLIRVLGLAVLLAGLSNLDVFAAAITPDTIYNGGTVGDMRLTIAVFSAGTADDADTWASGITGVVTFLSQGNDNPSTQANTGVDITQSAGTFTFYPAEDNKAFTLFVYSR